MGQPATPGIMQAVVLVSLLVSVGPLLGAAQPPYDPKTKDWASVVSACLAVGARERRLFNFFTRSCAHDSLSVVANVECATCGGADGSLFLSVDELLRPENAEDRFAKISARVIKKIARFYNTSVADTLAVCGMVSPRGANPAADLFKYEKLRVGKVDNRGANPAGKLPPGDIDTAQFALFWKERGFTVEEGVALLGSHTFIDDQGCYRGKNNNPRDYCDPYKATCTDIRMFQFNNHYYVDACTPTLKVVQEGELPPGDVFAEQPLSAVDGNEFEAIRHEELCKFTSRRYRNVAINLLNKERKGQIKPLNPPLARDNQVFWESVPSICRAVDKPKIRANCPHPNLWMYTVNDAHLGMACQGKKDMTVADNVLIQNAMIKYAENNTAWVQAYAAAFVKMVNKNAVYSNASLEFKVSGRECPSGYISTAATRFTNEQCQAQCIDPLQPCPKACICLTAFDATSLVAFRRGVRRTARKSAADNAPKVEPLVDNSTEPFSGAPIIDPTGPGGFPGFPLASPFGAKCVTSDGDSSLKVDGFPTSPMVLTPFQNVFKNPPRKKPRLVKPECRADSVAHCMQAYEFDMKAFTANPFDAVAPYCKTKPTWLLGYDGVVPGPTIWVPSGNESLVRFNNKISGGPFEYGQWPCLKGKSGRPVSIHNHGMKSLPPYDGWADDVICGGETKDYIYPNPGALTGWYHDHAFQVTAANAYSGLAGFYIVSDDIPHSGSCAGAPYNLEDIDPEKHELHLMLADKVLDADCQLRFDKSGAHHNNLYGDINLVSGIPWPVINVDPTLYRLRFVNAAPTRPYKLKIKTAAGADIAQNICQIIATDGGYRESPVTFPRVGLVLGVAERYELVCEFGGMAPGTTLYLWNDRDDDLFKGVPYFCFSHLLAKIVVGESATDAKPITFKPTPLPTMHIEEVLSRADYDAALQMATAGQYHRKMVFGRRHGHWVINGETWTDFKIAAKDVGQNTWEVWLLKTGGGWFHPIHIHLVDFFVLFRNGPSNANVLEYERRAPKDVVFLGPSQKIWVVARFGPHRGDYMFHCHNLIHEDDDMLRAFIVNDGRRNIRPGPPFLQLNGVTYWNWGYDNPLFGPTAARRRAAWPPITSAFVQDKVKANLHRIFYPNTSDVDTLTNPTSNPWKFQCKPPAAG